MRSNLHHRRGDAPLCRGQAPTRCRWAARCRAASDSKGCHAPPAPQFSFRVSAKQAASKLRLDAYLATQVAEALATDPRAAVDASRAKIQTSIAAGLVLVNGRPATKASQQLKPGDAVACSLPPPPPVQALPEAIPLEVRYEDEHLLVVNKAAGMVVHIAPGHHGGTLVNALLHHCALPPMDLAQASGSGSGSSRGELDPDSDPDLDPDLAAGDELADDEGVGVGLGPLGPGPAALQLPSGPGLAPAAGAVLPSGSASASVPAAGGVLRPGIVHRLDKGTSGLMVVAKSEAALVRLQAQFKARTTDRNYVSITVGCPAPARGRVETNICRDPRDRKRMAAAPYGSTRGRTAASGYSVEAALAGGGAALVRWKLDTGRTHQIRVHAKHVGHPLLGDEAYGGTGSSAVASVARGGLPADEVRTCVEELGRPALHALTLGFSHPVTGERLAFEVPPPEDFRQALQRLGGHWPM